jgi:2-polyprenyl-6-hydroxyphenyl methylase / 3-demethylubiquinone-9 3-methyltransferase
VENRSSRGPEVPIQMTQPTVNNAIYDQLGEKWYAGQDDPVALLRAESRLRNPYVEERIRASFGSRHCDVLDIGCGGGFLSNFLVERGHRVTGLDASLESLEIARRHDRTGNVRYLHGDAYRLPFENASFDVVCAMDFLEHVDTPAQAIAEAARVLRPGGKFFFYTFNRNLLARLVVIKGLEWFVANTPEHLHVYHLFIRPAELREMCARSGLSVENMVGMRPRIFTRAFFALLFTRRVRDDFAFRFTRSLAVSYLGTAARTEE